MFKQSVSQSLQLNPMKSDEIDEERLMKSRSSLDADIGSDSVSFSILVFNTHYKENKKKIKNGK